MQRDYYEEINSALKDYEEYHPCPRKTTEWIANRIDWAFKWRKITEDQMEELADRVIAIFERGK